MHAKAYQRLKVSDPNDATGHSIAHDTGGIGVIFKETAIGI
jgi:hypothetical protein